MAFLKMILPKFCFYFVALTEKSPILQLGLSHTSAMLCELNSLNCGYRLYITHRELSYDPSTYVTKR